MQIEEMAVEAALTGDPRLVFRAIAYDPVTAAVLSLREIEQMVNEMLEKNRDHLRQFKRFKAQQNPRRMLPQASERLGGALLGTVPGPATDAQPAESRPLEEHWLMPDKEVMPVATR